jgi:hypothetical protein
VAITESFGGLGGVGPDIVGIAVGQVHHQVVGLTQYPIDDHLGFAKVGLGVPRGVHQGHKYLMAGGSMLSHVVFDYAVLAAEPMSIPERWNIRWAVCRCFLGLAWSVWRIWSMMLV